MKRKILLGSVMLITSSLLAQSVDMKVIEKDGNQITVSTESIMRLTFALDKTHALVISQKDNSSVESAITNINKITFSDLTHVEDTDQRLEISDLAFVLRQNYPNPFNPSTTVEYELPFSGFIQIQIFNMNGQMIRNLESGYYNAGVHKVQWNGEDDNGQSATNGIYLCKVQFNNSIQVKKLLFVK